MRHEPEESIPPITVIVAKGDEDVTIKVADSGGGLPRSELKNLWTFASATLDTDDHGGKVCFFMMRQARFFSVFNV